MNSLKIRKLLEHDYQWTTSQGDIIAWEDPSPELEDIKKELATLENDTAYLRCIVKEDGSLYVGGSEATFHPQLVTLLKDSGALDDRNEEHWYGEAYRTLQVRIFFIRSDYEEEDIPAELEKLRNLKVKFSKKNPLWVLVINRPGDGDYEELNPEIA